MEHKKVMVSPDFPEVAGDRGEFLHLFANLEDYSTNIHRGVVICGERTAETYWADSHLLNWTWDAGTIMKIARNEGNPDPEFVKFVRAFMVIVGFTNYEDSPENRLEFETTMKGRMSFTRTTCGKYAFGTQAAYDSWRAARKYNALGMPPTKQQVLLNEPKS